jgi:hypothetical protein
LTADMTQYYDLCSGARNWNNQRGWARLPAASRFNLRLLWIFFVSPSLSLQPFT